MPIAPSEAGAERIDLRKRKRGNLQLYAQMWSRHVWQMMARNEIHCQVADAVRSPQVFVFRLRLGDPGDLRKVLALGEQFALTLSVPSVRVARHLGFVDLEIALPASFHRSLPVKALRRRGGAWINLGQTATGTPVHVNLDGNRACHALVSGITGSGKTVCEQLIAWQLAMGNEPGAIGLLLVDGKRGRAWWGFDREAHLVHPIVADTNEAIAALTWCVAELDRRKTNGNIRRLFVIVDEVRELLDVGGEPVAEAIRRVAALGRELGMHLILATQHPLVGALGSSITKANLPLRLTGMVTDANVAYIATGIKGSGAECLQGNGDFLLTVAGQVHRLQIGIVGNREIGRLPRVEDTPRLDFGDYDPVRVLDVTPKPNPAKSIEDEPGAVAFALAMGCGVPAIRSNYGPMGTRRAMRIRDFAAAIRAMLANLGYSYPLPVTLLSAETREKAVSGGYLVSG